ncbi:MAG: hypothetical protein FWG63_11490 [Defluviitaleaceae bacterium]|nr:hypothetical protein [Defluviitaleaceae bacterium]
MPKARRAKATVTYNGNDISDDIINFSYTDNYDRTDSISLTLSDRDEMWKGALFPETGATINSAIEVFDWNAPGDNRSIELGEFEISRIGHNGTATIDATAVLITTNSRGERKNRAWVDMPLSAIAGDISGNAGLALVYDTAVDPFYDQIDQNSKSDLKFLEQLCKSDGLCLKITDGQLIVYEEQKYEQQAAVATIVKGESYVIGFPNFTRNAKEIYKVCEISYYCPKTDRLYQGYFAVPNAPDVGHVLKLREDYNSEGDDINLDRKAKARAIEKNKYEWLCNRPLAKSKAIC